MQHSSLKFIGKLFLVILPVLFIVGLWEYHLSLMPTSNTLKKKYFEKKISEVETLIVGTSHAHHGINPTYFKSKAFNLANVSQSFYYDKELVLKYLPRMKKLKTVIIPISYFSFEFSLKDSNEYWRTFLYSRVYDIPPEDTSFYEPDIRAFSLIALYTRPVAIDYAFSRFTTPLSAVEPNGWEPLRSMGNCDFGGPRAEFHTSIMKSARREYSSQMLEDMITALQEKHIRILLITTPVCHSYAAHVSPQKYKFMQERISMLSNRYHIPYYNFFVDKRFVTKDFVDDHLNPYGAKKFSQILSDLVEKNK